ncbi:peptidoglycan-binding protein [Streptacidiphilus sp. PAMC 29251]
MARWNALPQDLDPAVVQLTAELRRLKDQSGLSLTRLAARTGYSASSWDRYLGARALPPAGAVEALAGAVAADPVRLAVLHDAAAEAWQAEQPQPLGPSDGTPPTEEGPEDAPTAATTSRRPLASRLPERRTSTVAVLSALLGAAVALLLVQPWQASARTGAPSAVQADAPATAVSYRCRITRSDGKWYAGESSTSTDQVVVGQSGPEVAELQCLLQRIGISPGGIDGSFGPLTERAVIQEQEARHLDVDGQVGPGTWGALRG